MISLSPLPSAHPSTFQRKPVRSSIACYGDFNLAKGRSLGFASVPSDLTHSSYSLSLRIRVSWPLTLHATATRRFIMQKARRRLSAPTACKRTVSGSISLPCSGFFPPFLHSTGSLSVFWEYLALRDGPRKFRQDSTCPALLRWLSRTNQLTSTGLSPSAVELSRSFQFIDSFPMITPTTPTLPKQYRFGLCRVRSPLLPTSMISFFSWGYLDVSVPSVRLIT